MRGRIQSYHSSRVARMEERDDDAIPAFRPHPMAGARGASLAKGGRRLSGRTCWNFEKNGGCPFGASCKYVHALTPSTPHHPRSPPLKYMLLKTQKQLGPDPSQSVLVAVLEQDGRFARTRKPEEASMLWGMSYPTGSHWKHLPPRALVNHFPNTAAITHKHRLATSLRALGPRGTDVAPLTFVLPTEARELAAVASGEKQEESIDGTREGAAGATTSTSTTRHARWIVKRAVGGEGKGITVATDAAAALECVRLDVDARLIPTTTPARPSDEGAGEAEHGGAWAAAAMPAFPSGSASSAAAAAAVSHVVQRLVPRPLLVDGFKVDIRAYVLVTSWGDGGGGGGQNAGGRGGCVGGCGGGGGGGGGPTETNGDGASEGDAAETETETETETARGNIAAPEVREKDQRRKSMGTGTAAAESAAAVRVGSIPRAYLYGEGLVRFAVAPFDPRDASPARHLTNNALATAVSTSHGGGGGRGGGEGAHAHDDGGGGDGGGGGGGDAHFARNWSLARFRAWLHGERGAGAFDAVWARAGRVAATAVAAAQPAVLEGLAHVRRARHEEERGEEEEEDVAVDRVDAPTRARSATTRETRGARRRETVSGPRHFCLLGVDLLVDADLRVWLLEVNSAPSLAAATRRRGCVSRVHHDLKAGLVADVLNLVDAGRRLDAGDHLECEGSSGKSGGGGGGSSSSGGGRGGDGGDGGTLEAGDGVDAVDGREARAEQERAARGKFESLSMWLEEHFRQS